MQVTDTVVVRPIRVPVYVPKPRLLAEVRQVAWTVAVTLKVVVAVAAKADSDRIGNAAIAIPPLSSEHLKFELSFIAYP